MNVNLYKAIIKGRDILLARDSNNFKEGNLYINGKFVGRVPFNYTIHKIIELEDKKYNIKNLDRLTLILPTL